MAICRWMALGVCAAAMQAQTTWHVDANCGDDNWTGASPICEPPNGPLQSLDMAVQSAQSGDTIIVADGIYTGPLNTNISFMGKALELRSAHGPNHCVIDLQNNGRAFMLVAGEGPDSIIDGFLIEHGRDTDDSGGGAILAIGASPTIRNCRFRNNTVGSGGALRGGGAILFDGGAPTVSDCEFSENRSAVEGGGVYSTYNTWLTLTRCWFWGNQGAGGGAALRGTLRDCRFESNAGPFGAGVAALGEVIMTNCIITGNTGLGIYVLGALEASNCTLADNTDGALGGFGPSPVMMTNCIVWEPFTPLFAMQVSYSDIWGGWPGTGNISVDPQFLYGLQGGYYLSQIAAGQSSDSPCLDAGDRPAADLGLHLRTTRTDELGDADLVDMGYHHPIGLDCNQNGVPDPVDLSEGTSRDCNANLIPDECDIAGGQSVDCQPDGAPDECQDDCNGNGVADTCDIADGTSDDCNGNGVPDECDIASGAADCNSNGILDACDVSGGASQDLDGSGVPDECELGDVNCDGAVTVGDIGAFVLAITDPGAYHNQYPACDLRRADVNQDGFVSVSDIGPFVALLTASPTGLIAYWPFDEGSGFAAHDLSGWGQHGVLYGGPRPEWVVGRYGTALDFHGDAEVWIPGSFDDRIGLGFTVAAWVKWAGSGNTSYMLDARSFNINSGFLVGVGASGHPVLYLYGPDDAESVGSGAAIPANVWTHLAVVYDDLANQVRFYSDGSLVHTGIAARAYLRMDGQGAIGNNRFTGQDRPFNGAIDEMRIFGNALTTEQVRIVFMLAP